MTATSVRMAPTSLPTRPFGTTGMAITRVGFGAWAVGGNAGPVNWGSQDDRESIAAIRHAVDCGINWVDTAPIYGLGHSEGVVAAALAEIPADRRPYVFTKCGLVWDDANPKAPSQRRGEAALIRKGVEDSLKRLGVERLDLVQMHWPAEDGTPLEIYWQEMLDLKAEGKVAAVGLSNHYVPQLEAAEKLGHVDNIQPPFSMIRRGVGDAELPWCVAYETAAICYSPMQAGLLTGRFSAERIAALDPEDWRRRNPYFQGDKLTANLKLADALKPIAERRGTTVPAVALAWALAWPGLTGTIVGARSPEQIDGWLDAATLELAPEDLDDIASAIKATGAGEGPARPPVGYAAKAAH